MGLGKFVAKALGGGQLIDRAAEVAKEYIEDPDLRNKVISEIIKADTQLKVARTNAKTIPWVDATHKMGRVILGSLLMIVFMVLRLNDVDVDLGELSLMAAPAGMYTLLKGRGR